MLGTQQALNKSRPSPYHQCRGCHSYWWKGATENAWAGAKSSGRGGAAGVRSTSRARVISGHRTSGPGVTWPAWVSEAMWTAKRLSDLLGRWFCPRGSVTMRKRRPGPAPPWRPSYLFATLSDGGRELTDYHIHTLDTGLFELLHLLFHCSFKSEVRCEEARPAPREEEGMEEERPRAGGKAGGGGESQAGPGPGGGVEDGTGMGGKRETPTQRKRERTEDNVSTGPSPPYCPPRAAPPRCCEAPLAHQALVGMGSRGF